MEGGEGAAMKAKGVLFLSILLSPLLVPPLPGQGCAGVPDGDAASGKVNQIPFGGRGPTGPFQNVRYQLRIPAAALPGGGGTVTSLQFAPADKGNYFFRSLEVRLAHLKGKKFSPLFADNLGGAVTVLSKSRWSWNVPKADAWTSLPVEGKFVWDGFRDILVEIVTQGASCSAANPGFHRSNSLECVYFLGYDAAKPARSGYGPFKAGLKVRICVGGGGGGLTLFGKACKGSGGRGVELSAPNPPTRGKSFLVRAARAPAGAAGVLVLGGDAKKFGSFSLPLSLAGMGAPGCFLYTDILTATAVRAGAKGDASLSLSIPSGAVHQGKVFYLQWVFLDPQANPAGVILSAGGKAKIR